MEMEEGRNQALGILAQVTGNPPPGAMDSSRALFAKRQWKVRSATHREGWGVVRAQTSLLLAFLHAEHQEDLFARESI